MVGRQSRRISSVTGARRVVDRARSNRVSRAVRRTPRPTPAQRRRVAQARGRPVPPDQLGFFSGQRRTRRMGTDFGVLNP